jgi:hypothetical protein
MSCVGPADYLQTKQCNKIGTCHRTMNVSLTQTITVSLTD